MGSPVVAHHNGLGSFSQPEVESPCQVAFHFPAAVQLSSLSLARQSFWLGRLESAKWEEQESESSIDGRIMATRTKKRAKAGYMISSVAELYKLHPQTLRLYERVGLLKPSRSQGNTRLYTDSDLERLEVILTLARDMGVNLAGIEIILNMREKMIEMEKQMGEFAQVVQQELSRVAASHEQVRPSRHAIVRVK
jgi:MerR family transcriptional regulator, heat shock protein HspR